MPIVFDHPGKTEDPIAQRFLEFYLARMRADQHGTIHVEDGERLVDRGPRPDYAIRGLGMLLEIGRFLDKERASELGGLDKRWNRILEAMNQRGLDGCWAIDIPKQLAIKKQEYERIAEDILRVGSTQKKSLPNWPGIHVKRICDGPLEVIFGETPDNEPFSLACGHPASLFAPNWKKIEHAAQQLSIGDDQVGFKVRKRILLLDVDRMAFEEWVLGWLHNQQTRFAALGSLDEVWAFFRKHERFMSVYSKYPGEPFAGIPISEQTNPRK